MNGTKAIAFDLGDTLVEYEGIPLNWEAHYPEALSQLASFYGRALKAEQIAGGCAILRRFNTRLTPREREFPFAVILAELSSCFGMATPPDEEASARAFFHIFRQRLRCFPEVKVTLERLRKNKTSIGIFTDVPYGMPGTLVLEDIKETTLQNSFDVLLTSRDIGYRKPSVRTIEALAKELNCTADEMIHVGNERKDIEVAHAWGCAAILIDRNHHGMNWGQDRTISSLAEL